MIETLDEKGYSFTAGLRVYNIADPEKPREIGFLPVDGFGLHRMWYIGGAYLYASAHIRGYTDYVLLVIDVSDPTKPAKSAATGCQGCGWPAARSRRGPADGDSPPITRSFRPGATSRIRPGATAAWRCSTSAIKPSRG